MKVAVLKLNNIHNDDKCKRKAMKIASTSPGVDSISLDMKEQKLTVTGNIDPVAIVNKMRKVFNVEVLSIGPVKDDTENEKEKEKEKEKEEPTIIDYGSYYSYPTYHSHPRFYY